MKPRKPKDLRDLTLDEMEHSLQEAQETLAKQKFQHALSQLHDTAYIKVLKKDIARIHTILKERAK